MASLVAQMVKNPPAMQETPVQFLSQEDMLEKGTATHSSILNCIVHGVSKSQTWLSEFHFHIYIYIYIYNFHKYIHTYTHTYAFIRKLNYFEKAVRKLKCQVNEPPRDNNHILSLKKRSMIKHYCSSFYFTYVGYWICLVGYTDTHKFFNSKSFRG